MLYMFRTVHLSIIRSLFTVHSAMVYVIHVCRQLLSRTWSCSKAAHTLHLKQQTLAQAVLTFFCEYWSVSLCDHIKTEPQHVAIRGAIWKWGRHVLTKAVWNTLNIQAIQLMLTCLSIHLINLGEHSDMSKFYTLILVNFLINHIIST
jgi:hypothetical protein